jgi:dihydroorotase/N-acyl-D-amino-acid deacylase
MLNSTYLSSCRLETTAHSQYKYDTVIINGRIIDGTGSPWYKGDIGIKDGRIARIGKIDPNLSLDAIDARGLFVAPGFIDVLGQSEMSLLVIPDVPSKLYQGITTEITGEGNTIAPINEKTLELDMASYRHYGIKPDWSGLRGYFEALRRRGHAINIGLLAGHTQIRRAVIGDNDREPTEEELQEMISLLSETMEQGAIGLSTALGYPPAAYAKRPELVALAKTASQYGGIYATHIRNESKEIIPALREAIDIGREADIPVEVWHLKAAGRSNCKRMSEIIEVISEARRIGVDISADTYAYPSWFSPLSSLLPAEVQDGGRIRLVGRLQDKDFREALYERMTSPIVKVDNLWSDLRPADIRIAVIFQDGFIGLQGISLEGLSERWQKSPLEALFDLLVMDEGLTTGIVFGICEEDIQLALLQPWTSIGTDAHGTSPTSFLVREKLHPRAYGTFPRILKRYVKEVNLLSWEGAIHKFTALAAQRFRLNDRGVLKDGMWADIVIFDPDSIADMADYDDPHLYSKGVRDLLVNGETVIRNEKLTGSLPGMILKGYHAHNSH